MVKTEKTENVRKEVDGIIIQICKKINIENEGMIRALAELVAARAQI